MVHPRSPAVNRRRILQASRLGREARRLMGYRTLPPTACRPRWQRALCSAHGRVSSCCGVGGNPALHGSRADHRLIEGHQAIGWWGWSERIVFPATGDNFCVIVAHPKHFIVGCCHRVAVVLLIRARQ
jgi:hypothetical protein